MEKTVLKEMKTQLYTYAQFRNLMLLQFVFRKQISIVKLYLD